MTAFGISSTAIAAKSAKLLDIVQELSNRHEPLCSLLTSLCARTAEELLPPRGYWRRCGIRNSSAIVFTSSTRKAFVSMPAKPLRAP